MNFYKILQITFFNFQNFFKRFSFFLPVLLLPLIFFFNKKPYSSLSLPPIPIPLSPSSSDLSLLEEADEELRLVKGANEELAYPGIFSISQEFFWWTVNLLMPCGLDRCLLSIKRCFQLCLAISAFFSCFLWWVFLSLLWNFYVFSSVFYLLGGCICGWVCELLLLIMINIWFFIWL